MTKMNKGYFKTASKKEREFIANRMNCSATVKDIVALAKNHFDELVRLHEQFLIQQASAKANQPTDETANQQTDETANQPTDETANQPTDETANQPTDETANQPTVEIIDNKFEITGTFTDSTRKLVNNIVEFIPEALAHRIAIHGDDKKKKIMVRFDKKLITKVFVQKTGYKVHLKTKERYTELGIDNSDVFFQNGFNLPYAKKTNLDTVKTLLESLINEKLEMVENTEKEDSKDGE